MAKVWIDYMDGQFSAREISDPSEVAELEANGVKLAEVNTVLIEAWHRHLAEAREWQKVWQEIDNENE